MAGPVNAAVTVAGRPLACVVCGEASFAYREVKLNTTGMTFFDLDWLNRSGVGAVCLTCGYLHTFVDGSRVEWYES